MLAARTVACDDNHNLTRAMTSDGHATHMVMMPERECQCEIVKVLIVVCDHMRHACEDYAVT